jgi:hypothetical protein
VVTCQKKGPLTTVTFLLPVTGGHSGRNGKRACFFPVIFRSFGSLSVVTDRHIKGVPTLPLFKVERIKCARNLNVETESSGVLARVFAFSRRSRL